MTSPNALCRTEASAHSRWWFTITTSDSAARCRIFVTKQSLKRGQSAPMQFSLVAAMSGQSGKSSGRSSISARSPVSVSRAHSSMHSIAIASSRDRIAGAVLQRLEAMQAEVIAAPLHVGGGERDAERLLQDRQVLEEDLLLEVLGAGRDQHALAAEDRGHEVGERLAGAGAGLGEQDAAVGEDVGDGRGHLELRGARLEAVERERQRSAGREDGADGRAERS